MDISQHYSLEDQRLSFTRAQASRFAKSVAGDFNPLHNEDARRFCVPGDLLFSVLISLYGLAKHTTVTFDGMVNEDTVMPLPESVNNTFTLKDLNDRAFLTIEYSEKPTINSDLINALVTQYVQFSGQTFPDILVELMRAEGVMINPSRPLVIYKSMSIELEDVDTSNIKLEFKDAKLSIEGKKGEAQLNFIFKSNGDIVGKGQKTMLLSGLSAYDQTAIDGIVSNYAKAKLDFADVARVD